MDWTKPTTQMLGRFQPWHKGHTELFKRCLAKTGQVIVQVRWMPKSDSNPFNWKEASQNIIDGLEAEGFKYGVEFEVMRVPNIVNITYGRDVGYKIEQETLGEEIESISATKIREEMKK
jgi:hypothetical protein